MSQKPVRIELSAQQSADLFWQLYRFEDAGIPLLEAIPLFVRAEKPLIKPIQLFGQLLQRGKAISEAGYRAGLFSPTQQALVHAAENSGKLAIVYKQLADHYSARSSRLQRIRSRLYFSICILVIALFVNPLPALVNGSISPGEYFLQSLGSLLSMMIGVWLLLNSAGFISKIGFASHLHTLQLKTPLLASWLITRQLNEFFFILGILLEAGLAFSTALPKAVATIPNTQLRNYFQSALISARTGASVAEVLSKVSVIKPSMIQIIHSSEQSGKLSNDLLHFSKIEAESLSLADDALAEWLPRLVYSIIAAWIAYSIIANQGLIIRETSLTQMHKI